jgi:hypothetical protein
MDTKSIIAALGIGALACGVMSYIKNDDIQEDFLGNLPPMKVKVDRSVEVQNSNTNQSDFYSIPGTYQSMISPRFSNIDYGANIRYNLPSYRNLAVPRDPLSMGNMVNNNYNSQNSQNSQNPYNRGQAAFVPSNNLSNNNNYRHISENFELNQNHRQNVNNNNVREGYQPPSCSKMGTSLRYSNEVNPMSGVHSNYSAGNFNQVTQQLYNSSEYPEATSMLPVGTMNSVNGLGEAEQPIVYDRYMYANSRSRLRSLGDPIRGDLAIVPCSAEWFRPSVSPNIDLQTGALNVMGGFDNDTSKKMADLINMSSGLTEDISGGVVLSNQYNTNLGCNSDILVSSYI